MWCQCRGDVLVSERGLRILLGAGWRRFATDSVSSKARFCRRYDSEQGRRPTLQCELRMGFPSTIAADDGVGLQLRRHPGCGGGFFTASCARLLG